MYDTVPQLQYLRADGLENGSILLEWRLEYDGGHPIVSFEIHISSGAGRTRRDTTIPDLVYHADINSNRLVTRTVTQGHTYSIVATAANVLGAGNPQMTNGQFHLIIPVFTMKFHDITQLLWVTLTL